MKLYLVYGVLEVDRLSSTVRVERMELKSGLS